MEKKFDELKAKAEETTEQIPPEVMAMISGGAGKDGYVCTVCGRTFLTITSIAAHYSSTHR